MQTITDGVANVAVHDMDTGTDVRAILKELAAHPGDEAALTVKLTALCWGELGTTGEALALLDQMQQARLLSPELSLRIKLKLSEIAFYATGVYQGVSPGVPLFPEREAGTVAAGVRLHGGQQFRQPVDEPVFPGDMDFKLPELCVAVRPDVPLCGESETGTLAMVAQPDSSQQFDLCTDEPVFIEVAPSVPVMQSLQGLRRGSLVFDRYLIVESLTVGPVCDTFMAIDKQFEKLPDADPYVMLRCLQRQTHVRLDALAALQNEFSSLQRIAHRSIAKAYDYIETPDLQAIAFAYGSGLFLSDVIERLAPRRLCGSQALTLIREIGLALAHAHARGVVHGRLSPGNIFIAASGDIRIYDFARADNWTEPTAGYREAPSARVFVSPRRTSAAVATTGDDIYSLARIADELLYGSRSGPVASWARGSVRNRIAIKRGLSCRGQSCGSDVRAWLATLDMRNAAFRLLPLAMLIEQAH